MTTGSRAGVAAAAAPGRRPDRRGFVHVSWGGHPRVIALADRPIGAMQPEDLSVSEAALRGPIACVTARPFLHLLRECLRHRFVTDVAASTPGAGLTADLMLAAGGEPSC